MLFVVSSVFLFSFQEEMIINTYCIGCHSVIKFGTVWERSNFLALTFLQYYTHLLKVTKCNQSPLKLLN